MEFHVHYGIPIHEISGFQPTDREHPSFCANQLLASGQERGMVNTYRITGKVL